MHPLPHIERHRVEFGRVVEGDMSDRSVPVPNDLLVLHTYLPLLNRRAAGTPILFPGLLMWQTRSQSTPQSPILPGGEEMQSLSRRDAIRGVAATAAGSIVLQPARQVWAATPE